MNHNTNNNDGRKFKWGREIKAPMAMANHFAGLEYELIGQMKRTTDPKEIEQNRLDEIERDQRNEAYDLESERLEKEWKKSHPKSEHYLWRSDIEHMKANNIPVGWLSDFWKLEKHIPFNQDEYLTLAQKAMKEGDRPVYNLFLDELVKIPLDWQKDFALVEEHIELSQKNSSLQPKKQQAKKTRKLLIEHSQKK